MPERRFAWSGLLAGPYWTFNGFYLRSRFSAVISQIAYKRDWVRGFEKSKEFFENFEEQFPIFKSWDRNRAPEIQVEKYLEYSLRILYADGLKDLSPKFLIGRSLSLNAAVLSLHARRLHLVPLLACPALS